MTFPCKKMRNDALHKINKHAYIEIPVGVMYVFLLLKFLLLSEM
jgi:hypothetical protein